MCVTCFVLYRNRVRLIQARQIGLPTLGSVAHATRKIMKQIMTKKLGARMNWCAQRGQKTGLIAYRHIIFGIVGKTKT